VVKEFTFDLLGGQQYGWSIGGQHQEGHQHVIGPKGATIRGLNGGILLPATVVSITTL